MTRLFVNTIIIVNLLVIGICIVSYSIQIPIYDSTTLGLISLLLLIPFGSNILMILYDQRFKYKYIRPTTLFILGYLIVFFQYNLDLLIGNTSANNVVFCSQSVILDCAFIALIGFGSFTIGNISGYKLSLSSNKNKMLFMRKKSIEKKCTLINKKFLIIQKILLILFTVTYVYSLGRSIMAGEYKYGEDTAAENAGSLANYSSVMIYVCVFTVLTTNIYNYKVKKIKLTFLKFIYYNGLLFNCSIIVFLILQFIVGDRGPIITIGLGYLISYVVVAQKKIPFIIIVISIVSAGLVFTTIGKLRHQTNVITVSDIISYKEASNDKTILSFTKELAGSYNTLTYSVKRIPEEYDYFYGVLLIRETLYTVPFLHRFFPFLFSKLEYENTPTSFCTFLIQGYNPTYGNGSSILADIFLNFGVLGIVIIMFFWGILFYKLDIALFYSYNYYWILSAVIFFSFSLYSSRAPILTPLYYLIPALIVFKFYSILQK